MILMPGCAFSDKLERLGRGGGFYDRYLTAYQKRHGRLPHLFALSFHQQLCRYIPMEKTDVKLHKVIYEPCEGSGGNGRCKTNFISEF